MGVGQCNDIAGKRVIFDNNAVTNAGFMTSTWPVQTNTIVFARLDHLIG